MMNRDSGNRVVISGISGRFPNSNNIFEFQNNLLNKVDCTTTEHERWDFDTPKVPQRIGPINNLAKFDRVFFGVHSRLTAIMDPGSRLLLEHCFEAVMDAGINPRSLKGANIAVFTATHLSESEKTVFHNKVQQDGFGIMGCSKAMIPNRVSFFLGLNGSSINIDSADTGSGTALECAYHHIKEGRCDGAIVAGSMLALHPHVSYQLRALGLLSPDGVTRSFDDTAEGHTRSESVSVLFLQRARDAKRIYQEVLGARTTHADCQEINTVLYPNMECQASVMREMLRECGLTPDDIAYLEASGVSIRDADADELKAIDTVYGKRKKPLLVGSIKSIIGNAVSANTVNSIIKMIIASETGQIPPNVNYETPNTKAPCLVEGRVEIPTELTPWTGEYSSVNTTSMCGVFANVLLRAPNIEKKNSGIPNDDLPRLVIASGRTEEAVDTLLEYMESRPVDADYLQLLYDIFQSEIDAHLFRGYTIVPAKGLPATDSKKREMLFQPGQSKEVWWVFSGMGSQWAGMGEALLRLPVFEAAIRKCDAVLKPHGYDIFKVITDKDPKAFDLIINSFIGIAAIQIGLVDVLRAVGLEPDFIIGHSVGELGCAYADGCFTAEQMIMAALSRGLASVETKLVKGAMAAVGLGYEDVKPLCPPDIDVACHNGPESTTISGPAESLRAFVADLTARGIFAREVASSNIAYHSRYIAPAGPKLLERLQKVIPKPNPRSSKWVSTSVPRREWNTLKARLSSAEYHTNNLLSPVLFDETSKLIPSNAICIEIAPHGLLQAILKRSLPESCVNIPLTRRGHPDNLELLLTALGKMYNVGLQPQVANLYPKVQYPVGRGTPSISSLVKWDHSTDWLVNYYSPIEEVKEGQRNIEINLNDEKYNYLKGNVVNGKITIPLPLCLIYARDILKDFDPEAEDFIFEDIKIHKLLVTIPSNDILELTIMVPKGTGKFEVVESDKLVVSGTVKSTKTPNQDKLDVHLKQSDKYELSQDDLYTELKMRGFHLSGDFKNILKSSIDGNSAVIRWKDSWITFIESALQLFTLGNDVRRVEVPLSIRKIIIDQQKQDAALKLSKDLGAVMDKKLNYISVGGLEIQGLKFSVVPKIFENNVLTNDTLKFVPNLEKSNLSLGASIRLILQLVIENTFSNKLRKIQFVQDENSSALNKFNNILRCIPEVSLFRVEAITLKGTKFNKSLTIISPDQKYNLNEIAQKVKDGKFLLTFVSAFEENTFVKLAESLDLKVVFTRKSNNESVVLLRKKIDVKHFQMVNASKNVQEIVNKVKTTKTSENERVVVLVKSKDISDVSELVNQLEKSVNLEKVRILNIQDLNVADYPLTDQFYAKQLEQDLLINILTAQKVWGTIRRMEINTKLKLHKNWSANNKNSYDPDDITWAEGIPVENMKNPIKVEYSALNSQDILIANGNFYSDPSEMIGTNRLTETSLGLEFSGVNSKGNKVIGVSCGNAMSNYVDAHAEWLWDVPKSWSLEDAVTVPLSYIVAYSALAVKAEAKPGERVMLYNSCDGLGLAILNLAVSKKCDVFVTYETEAEKKLIRSTCPNLPENRLFKLSGNNFRDAVQVATQGQGVDVVISNQSEVKKLEVFFTMTKRNARVVLVSDLTENQVHEKVGMEIFLREIALFSVVPKRILLSDSETKKTIANLLKEGIDTGCVKPLAKTVYARDSLDEAFSACAKKQLGKAVVRVQPEKSNSNEALAISRLHCSNKNSYIVIEGLTTFGLELIDWLITRGARRFVVASAHKNDSGYKSLRMKLWQSYRVQIVLRESVDLQEPQIIKSLFKEANSLGPVDAIFDLRRTDTSKKADSVNVTTKIVDLESRLCHGLRLFVVCAAVTNTGRLMSVKKFGKVESDSQSKEVEAILEKRRKDGVHGSFVRLGLIGDQNNSSNILPPYTKYLEKLDQSLEAEEITTDIICEVAPTNEVEDDIIDDDSNLLDPELREAQVFAAGLYEQYGVHVEGYSYLQI